MPTSTKVKNLNINELTEAQYDAAVQGGVIGANELSVLTDVNYAELGDLATVATTGDYSDLINRPTNLVSTNTAQTISGLKTFSGDITLSGTTSIKNNTGGTNYTMLYRDATTIHVGASTSVLKLEGSGTRPAYNNDSLALLSDVTGGLPSQTGNAGKFLTTDGTDASWSDKPLVNNATPTNSLSILGTNTTSDNTITIGKNCNVYGVQGNNVVIGNSVNVNYCPEGVAIGNQCTPYNYSVCVGKESGGAGTYAVSLGWKARVNATHAIQIGNTGSETTNSDANTMKVANTNGNFEIMSADGTIPEARLADTTNAQQGDVLTLDANGDAVWQAGGGGSGLPDQTGNAGKFLTTDGTDTSWAGNVVVDTGNKTVSSACYAIFGGTSSGQYGSISVAGSATGTESIAIGHNASGARSVAVGGPVSGSESVAIGRYATASAGQCVAVGKEAKVENYRHSNSIVIGYMAKSSAIGAIQIGKGTNSTAGTMSVSLTTDGTNFNNYELLSADGTIPAARHAALPAADGTYTLQLVIADGVPTLSWVAV